MHDATTLQSYAGLLRQQKLHRNQINNFFKFSQNQPLFYGIYKPFQHNSKTNIWSF